MTPSSQEVDLLARVERMERQESERPPPPMNPDRAGKAFAEARALAARGRYAEALPLLTVAAGSPRFAGQALVLRARLEVRLARPFVAISTLKDALHRSTDDILATVALYADIAEIYSQVGEREEATYYLRRAVRLAPARQDLRLRLDRIGDVGLHRVSTKPTIQLPN